MTIDQLLRYAERAFDLIAFGAWHVRSWALRERWRAMSARHHRAAHREIIAKMMRLRGFTLAEAEEAWRLIDAKTQPGA